MKIKVIFFLFILTVSSISAQDKRDYQWVMGTDQEAGSGFSAYKFDFNKNPFSPEIRDKGLRFDQTNASVSDEEGRLLFYTNGCAVANRDHEIMMGGDLINDGEFLDDFWSNGGCWSGYPGRQDILILEDPINEEAYYIIHKTWERAEDGGFDVFSMSYSYVDLTLDGGLGAVVESNVDFYTMRKFLSSYLTAINQSNGEDWWIINPGIDSVMYIFSLDDEGLNLSQKMEVPTGFDQKYASSGGDAKFSPDGSKYAYFNLYDGLLLYDFDRSTGELSNVRQLSFTNPMQAAFATCEWSPNSEFLYLASADTLWQLEVSFEDLEEGKVFIAEHNGVNDPFSTQFFLSALGPDCKIYIRPGSSSNSFHVINKPNQKGTACDLVQQGLVLPLVSARGGFPNFPRFRVDDDEKCDPSIISVFGEEVYWRRDLNVYPNPADDYVTIEIPENRNGDLYIIDAIGQLVYHRTDYKGIERLDVSFLPIGIYRVEIIPTQNEGRMIYTSKLVIVE